MIKEGFITLIKNHSKGKSARIYSLNIKFIQQKNKRYVNSDKVIVKKWREKKLSNTLIESNLIDSDVKSKLISDLFSVEIQLDKVIWFLDHLKDNNYNIYNKNQNSSEAIEDGSIFHEFDRFGRMHTNFTTLKSVLRKNCILIDGGEPTEFDIKNSQPLFLTKLIIDSGSKWVDQDELSFFKGLTMNGTYYDFLEEKYDLKDRKEAKDLTYKVLFSVNKPTNKPDKIFRKYFPTIYKFIQLYKKEHKDYRALAHELQRQESNFIFNKLVKHIMLVHPDIKIITVHDSIIVNNKHRGVIQPIFNRMLSEEFNF